MTEIDLLLEAIIKAQSGMDARTFWPCHPAQIEAYFSDLIALDLLEKYRQDKEKFGQAIDEVPVDILRFHLLDCGLIGLEVLRKYKEVEVSVEDILEFVSVINASIKKRIQSDIFCLDGQNKILSDNELFDLINNKDFYKLSSIEERRMVSSFYISAESYVWSLYFDLYRDAGLVIHGLYDHLGGKLLIRDFLDFTPDFLLGPPQIKPIKLFLLYDSDFTLQIDYANHPQYQDSHLDHLKGFLALSDNQELKVEDLLILEKSMEDSRSALVKKIEELKPYELIWEGAKRYWYLFKDFFAYYDLNHQPPDKIKERIEEQGLKYWERYEPGTKKPDLDYYRLLYDPRNSFLG